MSLAIACFFACIDEKSGKGKFVVLPESREKLSRFGLNTHTLWMKPTAGGIQYVGRDVTVYVKPTYYKFTSGGKEISGMRPVADKIKLKDL